MNSIFDSTATTFDSHRSFPKGIAEAIRAAAWRSSGRPPQVRVLDLGAGTGRVGKAFVQADDCYVGVDFSLAMLSAFAAQCPAACLIQADGQRLPFADGSFGLILLMQVVGGAGDSLGLLQEALRVAALPGAIIIGQTIGPASGVDEQMKRQLNKVLKDLEAVVHEPKKARENSVAWLKAQASRHRQVTAASWIADRSPEQFIARHRTGARFAALSPGIQAEALRRLSAWAQKTFGSLDRSVQEDHDFILDIFEM